MYKSFRVKNFRCFKDLQINDLGRVNLIAGKNNTGKTALMEAMLLLTVPLTPQLLTDLHNTRGLDDTGQDRREVWQQFFLGRDTSLDIDIRGIDDAFNGEIRHLTVAEHATEEEILEHIGQYVQSAKQLGLIGEGTIDIRGISLLSFSFDLPNSQTERIRVYLPSKTGMPVYTNILFDQHSASIPVEGRPSTEWIRDNFSTLDLNGDLPQLLEYLATFESRLSDLRLLSLSGDLTIWGRVNSYQIPLKMMGEGVNRFSNLAILMLATKPNHLFIDEIENGIHYSVQTKVWEAIGQMARELDIQVFATTHSYEMIKAAHEAFKDNDPYELRFHRLNRRSDTGEIEAITYNKAGIEAFVRSHYEVRG